MTAWHLYTVQACHTAMHKYLSYRFLNACSMIAFACKSKLQASGVEM